MAFFISNILSVILYTAVAVKCPLKFVMIDRYRPYCCKSGPVYEPGTGQPYVPLAYSYHAAELFVYPNGISLEPPGLVKGSSPGLLVTRF